MTATEIIEIAKEYLIKIGSEDNLEYCFFPDGIMEEEDFVLFTYNSKNYIETENEDEMMLGTNPLIITKQDGKIYIGSNAFPIEYMIEYFKEHGIPYEGYVENRD
jgi:hypothetical protein